MPSPRPRDRGHNDHDERDDDDNHGEGSSQGTTRSQRAKLPPPRSHHPPIQQCSSVSSYERLNRIEEGSYGIVYRARHLATGQVVALKKLKMQNERSGFPITSLREIRTLMMASHHPNVVRLQEVAVGDTLTQVYLVFEFVEHDLKTLLVDMGPGLFSLSEIKSLLRQLLSGLAHLHAQWIIHRDLKTSNLLLDNRGTLKIADFGLARLYGDGPPRRVDDEGGGAGNKDGDTGSASPGALTDLVVTLWYRSPELLLGETDYDTAIDVWSVGCIMAELLKGEPLFQGRNESDQILKIFQTLGPPTPASWPKANSLPLAKGILSSFARSPLSSSLTGRSSRSLLASHLPPKYAAETHGSACLDVLLGLLCYDPSQRLTADEATHHPWFASEPPRPAHPESFGTWPSRAAGETRRKVTLPEDARAKSPPAPRAGPQRQQRGGTADDEDGGGSGSGSGSSSVPRKRGAGTDSPQRKKYQLDFGF